MNQSHENTLLPVLQELINRVWHNPYSDMYTALWKTAGFTNKPILKSLHDFASLPSLSKDQLARIPLENKLFAPNSESWTYVASSSGTSGSPPLYSWRHGLVAQHPLQRMYDQGARTCIVFMQSTLLGMHLISAQSVGIRAIKGNLHQLEHSLDLIEIAGVDSIICTPSTAQLIGIQLAQRGYSEKIIHISMMGEPCSRHSMNQITSLFPRATTTQFFGISEVGLPVAFQTPSCPHNHWHPEETYFYLEEVAGEMLLTNIYPDHISPVIRYRTGDSVTIDRNKHCVCGTPGAVLHFNGRKNVDFVRVAGVEIRSEQIEEIVLNATPYIKPIFNALVHEQPPNNQDPVYDLEIIVSPTSEQTDPERISRELIRGLIDMPVSASSTLSHLIDMGLFSMPTITLSQELDSEFKTGTIKLITQ